MAKYSINSPYYKTSDAAGYLDVMTFRDIPAKIDDELFEVTTTYAYRPDLLSNYLYKTPELWWVFAMRNQDIIKDPVYDLVPGIKIYLPKLAVINAALGA
jgi:hypothetical protein